MKLTITITKLSLHFYTFFSTMDPVPEAVSVKATKPKKAAPALRASLSGAPKSSSGDGRQLPPRPTSAMRSSSPVVPVMSSEERFVMLSKPIHDKFATPPRPPRHSDKLLPALPHEDVIRNQTQAIEGLGPFRLIPANCDKLRFSIDVVSTLPLLLPSP